MTMSELKAATTQLQRAAELLERIALAQGATDADAGADEGELAPPADRMLESLFSAPRCVPQLAGVMLETATRVVDLLARDGRIEGKKTRFGATRWGPSAAERGARASQEQLVLDVVARYPYVLRESIAERAGCPDEAVAKALARLERAGRVHELSNESGHPSYVTTDVVRDLEHERQVEESVKTSYRRTTTVQETASALGCGIDLVERVFARLKGENFRQAEGGAWEYSSPEYRAVCAAFLKAKKGIVLEDVAEDSGTRDLEFIKDVADELMSEGKIIAENKSGAWFFRRA